MCFHIAAVIWFLAIGRHNSDGVASIQDWSQFVTDATVIDESDDSDLCDEE